MDIIRRSYLLITSWSKCIKPGRFLQVVHELGEGGVGWQPG